MVRENDNLPVRVLRDCADAAVEPLQVTIVGGVVLLDGPVLDDMEVVEAVADVRHRRGGHSREQRASQNGDAQLGNVVVGPVEQDVLTRSCARLFGGAPLAVLPLEFAQRRHGRLPVGSVWLVVPDDVEHAAELGELALEETQIPRVVHVANVSEKREVWRGGRDAEDIVCPRTLEVKIGYYLDGHLVGSSRLRTCTVDGPRRRLERGSQELPRYLAEAMGEITT